MKCIEPLCKNSAVRTHARHDNGKLEKLCTYHYGKLWHKDLVSDYFYDKNKKAYLKQLAKVRFGHKWRIAFLYRGQPR
jgi:hypothetical protein